MTEFWRDIPGIPDYQVSNKGGVRGTGRKARCKGGFRSVKPKVLSCYHANSTGYTQVEIRGVRYSVHRLVAQAWCEGYFDGAVVDHLNNIRDDNRDENLEWVTHAENVRRAADRGRSSRHYKGVFSGEHPTAKSIIATNIETGEERIFAAGMDAVREGFDSSCISRCCNGLSGSHKGFYWRFAQHGVVFHDSEGVAA